MKVKVTFIDNDGLGCEVETESTPALLSASIVIRNGRYYAYQSKTGYTLTCIRFVEVNPPLKVEF